MKSMSTTKLITICKCDSCGKPVKVSLKLVGQLMAKQRKTPVSSEFMSQIAKKRHADNRSKKI